MRTRPSTYPRKSPNKRLTLCIGMAFLMSKFAGFCKLASGPCELPCMVGSENTLTTQANEKAV